MAELEPAAVVQAILARCREARTPCGDGSMVWRIWGQGAPVVLLHGGSGSWNHWIKTIPALEPHYTLYVADLPGLGDSAMPPRPYDPRDLVGSTEHLAEIVCAGIDVLLTAGARYRLIGFSFGSITGGYVARRHGERVEGLILIGAAALGIRWPGLNDRPLTMEDGMSESEVAEVMRHNLHTIMMRSPPEEIDALAVHLQYENTLRARLRTHMVAPSDTLIRALREVSSPLAVIWGRDDVFANPDLAERGRVLRGIRPDLRFHIVDGAGHWAMYEAAAEVNALLFELLQERRSNASAHRGGD